MNSRVDRRGLLRSAGVLTAGAVMFPVALGQEVEAESRSSCRIISVCTCLLRHTLTKPFGVSVSVPLDKTREALLVRIESDRSHVGWGETSPLPGRRAAIDQLGTQLIGEDPVEYRRLWRSLWGANFGNALAVAGLDVALHDLRGKSLVCRLQNSSAEDSEIKFQPTPRR